MPAISLEVFDDEQEIQAPIEVDMDLEQNETASKKLDGTQDWSKVDSTAWVILVSISVECLIEGIAFSLILRGKFGGGIAVFTAMVTKTWVTISNIVIIPGSQALRIKHMLQGIKWVRERGR